MTTNANTDTPGTVPIPATNTSTRASLFKLPGLIAISLYLILLAITTAISVVVQHTGFVYLVFAVLFIAGALGLLLLLRWAWALTLAAVAILSGSFFYGFSRDHSAYSALVQGLLNLLFFLYLVRTDVREKLK